MLKINSEAMYKGLQLDLIEVCEEMTDWIWAQAEAIAPPQVDRAQMHKEVVVVAGTVVGTFSAGGMQALITEWGSGSLADESNPAWPEYTESKYYNPARFPYGHPITGRPAGTYVDLDGSEHTSSGAAVGLNLEHFLRPQEPLHWLEGIVTLSRPYVLQRIVTMVSMFPFHAYMIGGD